VEKSAQRDSEFSIPPAACSFEELALQQGVAPILDFESLIGHPSAEDESAEEFSAQLRDWRRETTLVPDPYERRNP
jgi:hypothetical protein